MADLDAVVLGAGPSGLGAVLALARSGARAVAVDAAPEPGGLCVTRRRAGFAYDIGGHIPFVRDDARRRWLGELLGEDLGWVDRPVSCVRDGRVVRGRYLDQRPPGPADGAAVGNGLSAAGELAGRFGATFVDAAMRRYLEKVDGVPLERIPGDRARKLLEDQAAPDGFHFPARGIGQLMDAMAAAARGAGAEVRLGTAVAAIEAERGRFARVRLRDGASLSAPAAIVAMPAGAAARLFSPAPAGWAPVRMRAVCIVYLRVGRDRLTREPWIQVDDPRVPFARAFEPRNWSAALSPRGRTLVGLECYCQADEGDPVWSLGDDRLAGACAAALHEPLGLLDDPAEADLLEVIRLPGAYPVADVGQLAAIRAPVEWLAGIGGVHLAPGAAVIEAIAAGERAAAAALGSRGLGDASATVPFA